MNSQKAKVLANTEVQPGFYQLVLFCPEVAAAASAGQFLMIKPTNEYDPFLARPMAIYDYDKTMGTIEILFMVKGRGTQILAKAKADDILQVVAPLGKGFQIQETDKTVLCVADGVGMAPIYSLIKELHKRGI